MFRIRHLPPSGGDNPKRAFINPRMLLQTVGAGGVAIAINALAANNVIYYNPTAALGDEYTTSFMLRSGNFILSVLGITNADACLVDWYVDGVLQAGLTGQDWYSAGLVYNVVLSGSFNTLSDGYHVLKMVLRTRAPSVTYQWRFMSIDIRASAD